MSKTRFYDLAEEDEAIMREAEMRHHEAETRKELTAIREATQSMCALLMGLVVRNG